MSEENKPLIFLEPLSDTLKKLKEVLEENTDAEGIEIFDVESIDEANQLIPTIGQAVLLTASPKVCAMTLQTNRKFIKKLQTKVLLLSPKAIPRKTLDKFMKVGLTECIVEPVNPKTLLYKVRLQLRSINTAENQNDEEMQKKFGEDSASETLNTQQKLRAEKGVILDDEQEDKAPEKRKERKEETLEDFSKPKKKMAQEEVIDGFYRGKQKAKEETLESDEDQKKKNRYREEAIEGHYKGKLDEAKVDVEDEKEDSDKVEMPLMDEDIEAIKRQLHLEVEKDIHKKSQIEKDNPSDDEEEKKAKKASLEMDHEKDNKNKTLHLLKTLEDITKVMWPKA
jgi:DNA-binding response OmpR family regulator